MKRYKINEEMKFSLPDKIVGYIRDRVFYITMQNFAGDVDSICFIDDINSCIPAYSIFKEIDYWFSAEQITNNLIEVEEEKMEKLYRIKDVKGFMLEVPGNDDIVDLMDGRNFFIDGNDINSCTDICSIRIQGTLKYKERGPCWFTSNEVDRFLEEITQWDDSEVPEKDESRSYFVMSKDPHRSRYEASDLVTLEEAKEKAVVISKQGFEVFIARHHLGVEVKTVVNFF